jgi:hypothetical protein
MDHPRLTTRQAAALRDRVMPMLRFLLLCRRRLDVLGFDSSHPIYRAIDTAHCAVQDLYIVSHREAVGQNVPAAMEEQPPVTPPTDQAQEPQNRPGA